MNKLHWILAVGACVGAIGCGSQDRQTASEVKYSKDLIGGKTPALSDEELKAKLEQDYPKFTFEVSDAYKRGWFGGRNGFETPVYRLVIENEDKQRLTCYLEEGETTAEYVDLDEWTLTKKTEYFIHAGHALSDWKGCTQRGFFAPLEYQYPKDVEGFEALGELSFSIEQAKPEDASDSADAG